MTKQMALMMMKLMM